MPMVFRDDLLFYCILTTLKIKRFWHSIAITIMILGGRRLFVLFLLKI